LSQGTNAGEKACASCHAIIDKNGDLSGNGNRWFVAAISGFAAGAAFPW
jgi:hypothetical protein